MTDYADLELGLHRFETGIYTVEMRFSIPGSDTDTRLGQGAPVQVNLNLDELRELQLDPQEYANTLTKAFFEPTSLQVAFAEALASAQSQDLPLRLRLLIGSSAPELHNLRWELLCNPKTNASLATDEMILFSRYLSSTDWRPVKLLSKGDLKALIAVANPSDLGNYKLAAIDEAGEIERAQKGLDQIQSILLPKGAARATLNNIIESLQTHPCYILYLVCHGFVANGLPILCLENGEGKMERVFGNDFVTRIHELHNRPRLVEAGVIRFTAPDLRHFQFQLAHPGLQPPGLGAVAMSLSFLGPLVELGPEVLRYLLLHRLVAQPVQQLLQSLLLTEQSLHQPHHVCDTWLRHRSSPC
jgi:hypothetical protein